MECEPSEAAGTVCEQPVERFAQVLIDTGSEMLGFANLAVNESETAWSLLSSLAQRGERVTVTSQDYGDMGVLITNINRYKNGDEDKYWQYWVNGEYANVSASKYVVEDRDVMLWKFTSSRYEYIEAD